MDGENQAAEDDIQTDQPSTISRKESSASCVFISHDSRDAELAEAFSALLRKASAGTLKSFRSSDKKGTEGIEFGDDWYRRLMEKLDNASDVVCLLTERSLERPWILYEAGVAKGKLKTPVLGVALGIPLNKVSIGPFYHFQNCDDDEESLTKLVLQLARRIPGVDPDSGVVQDQVQAFKSKIEDVLNRLQGTSEARGEAPIEAATARLFEELKSLVREMPETIENRISISLRSELRQLLQDRTRDTRNIAHMFSEHRPLRQDHTRDPRTIEPMFDEYTISNIERMIDQYRQRLDINSWRTLLEDAHQEELFDFLLHSAEIGQALSPSALRCLIRDIVTARCA